MNLIIQLKFQEVADRRIFIDIILGTKFVKILKEVPLYGI